MIRQGHSWNQNRGAQQGNRRSTGPDGYYHRAPILGEQRRVSVKGQVTSRRHNTLLVPGSRGEYLDALAGKTPRRAVETAVLRPFSFLQKKSLKTLLSTASRQKQAKFLPSFFIMLLVVGSIFLLVSQRRDAAVQADRNALTSLIDEGDTPSEKRPYNEVNYHVAPALPRTLKISKLGVDARVVRTTVRVNSEPAWPTNIYDAGWYENSAKPGEEGATLLIGHLSGSERNGVFFDLTSLVPGDTIELTTGNGAIHHYYIVKMEAYRRNQIDTSLLSQSAVPGRSGLNLLTAVGNFERNADVVQQLVVFAVSNGVQPSQEN